MDKDPIVKLTELKIQDALERLGTADKMLRDALTFIQKDSKAALIQAGQDTTHGRNMAADAVRLLDEILTLGEPLPRQGRRRA